MSHKKCPGSRTLDNIVVLIHGSGSHPRMHSGSAGMASNPAFHFSGDMLKPESNETSHHVVGLTLNMTFKYEKQKFNQGYNHVIGCDEVGRGCLAGPVVAAAVVFPMGGDKLKVYQVHKVIKSAGIRDSKLLSAKKREELSEIIKQHFLWSVGEVSSEVVDKINIHNASLLAMRKAVEGLTLRATPTDVRHEHITSGRSGGAYYPKDNRSPSTALRASPNTGSSSDALLLSRDGTTKMFLALDGKFTIPEFNIEQQAIIGGDNKVLSIAAASIIAKVYRDNLMRKYHEQYPVYDFKQHKGYATVFHRTMVKSYGMSPIHRLSFCTRLV